MKIGIINYINSIPFRYGIEAYGDIVADTPRRLAVKFFAGELDIAFIPAVEYIRMRDCCYLVPGITIASHGSTGSVSLFYNGNLRRIKRVKLSNESRTSNFLLGEILERHYHLTLDYIERGDCDAELIIGDKALLSAPRHYRQQLDIGRAWLQMTGLPVVYAVCVAHNAADAEHFAPLINRLTRDNLSGIEQILGELGMERYCRYIKNLDYALEAPQQRALDYMSRLYQARYQLQGRADCVCC